MQELNQKVTISKPLSNRFHNVIKFSVLGGSSEWRDTQMTLGFRRPFRAQWESFRRILIQCKGSKCCTDGLNNIQMMWEESWWWGHRACRGYRLFWGVQNSLSRPERILGCGLRLNQSKADVQHNGKWHCQLKQTDYPGKPPLKLLQVLSQDFERQQPTHRSWGSCTQVSTAQPSTLSSEKVPSYKRSRRRRDTDNKQDWLS